MRDATIIDTFRIALEKQTWINTNGPQSQTPWINHNRPSMYKVLFSLLIMSNDESNVDAWCSVDSFRSLLFGHDRNLSEAAKYMALAAEKGCGRCFFYLGAMLALGEPETNVSARFKVLSDGNIEFRCLDTNRYSQEKEMMKWEITRLSRWTILMIFILFIFVYIYILWMIYIYIIYILYIYIIYIYYIMYNY